jgi:putative hydrolase of the HAD superfamily
VTRAIFFDFGGVVSSSPLEAFRDYERRNGIPEGFIVQVNSRNGDDNAWARIERNDIDIDEFDALFARETEHLGHRIPGRDMIALLRGDIRTEMLRALDLLRAHNFILGCLTNNVVQLGASGAHDEAFAKFHFVVESSKVNVRKPEPRFYEIACELANVQPSECVFLDDLGINLKPARAMGMTTIKVTSANQALKELSGVLGIDLL